MTSPKSGITTQLFDWDGTLLDSARPGMHAFQRTLEDLGVPFDAGVYHDIYSPNWYSMYEALGVPLDRWADADRLWLRHYGEELPRLVEGARETLDRLSEKGYLLGIVSSGSECRIRREIETLGLDALFRVIICNESTVNKKPHPEGLNLAIKTVGRPREACSYVGDTPEDIEMGRRAGVLTIGVHSGYPGRDRLIAAVPDLYLESIRDLLLHF
jgi:HAD superfamily hydrolase (TIGR01509 family)